MQKRSVRAVALLVLLAATSAAAYVVWDVDRRAAELTAAEDAMAARVDRMRAATAGLATAHQGYIAPGQLDEPWFERSTELLQLLGEDVTASASALRSPAAHDARLALVDSVSDLDAADRRIRQSLALGEDLMAADVIFSDGRDILASITAGLDQLHAGERDWYRAAHAAAASQRWLAFGLAGLLWLAAGTAVAFSRGPAIAVPPVGAPEPVSTAAEPPPARAPVPLAAAAALCSDLSRVAEAGSLPALLGRAASIFDASGLILWMGAGERLFAVLGHGYSTESLARFGPMARDEENAVALAWRSGRLAVASGDDNTPGAIVAPLFSPDACIGVLSLELTGGREHDPASQALATVIAAQLGTVVSAWPGASAERPAGEVRSA